jgi:hypothetical protein
VKIWTGLIIGVLAGVGTALILGAMAGANPPCAPTGRVDHSNAFHRAIGERLWGAMANFTRIAPFTVLIGAGLGTFIGYRHHKYGRPPEA